MRYKLAAVLACVALLVAACGLTVASGTLQGKTQRYWQHEQAQQLADLPQEEREAASSLSTKPKSFASHLPVVSISTGGADIPGSPLRNKDGSYVLDDDGNHVYSTAADGSESVSAQLQAFDAQGRANRLSDEPSLSESCLVHVRGNSSRHFIKKSYAIKFTDEDGLDKNVGFLGMSPSESWVLYGPCLDKTLLRNYLSYGLAGEFMSQYVPQTRFCELFLNGEYQGLYLAVETPKVGDGRIELTKSDPRSAQTSWLVQVQPYEDDDAVLDETFLEYTLRQRSASYVEYPGALSITSAQKDSIEAELSAFEKALYSFDYDTSQYGYWTYV
ncbi:MAG: CotH kinase family protein, partial [Coriobacteriales bacterium]